MQPVKERNSPQAARRGLVWPDARVLRLWLYGLAMLAPAWAFAWHYPLAASSGGLTDVGKLSGYRAGPFAQYVAGMAAMFALYLLALRESRGLEPRRALPAIFGCAALLAIGMCLMYPVNAIDVFLYAARSRLLTAHGANPSAALPRDFPTDAWAPFMTPEWARHPSPYGPLWNLIAAPVTALAGQNMLAALLGFKLLMAAALLAGGWAIARALAVARPHAAGTGALLYLWNPLVLWEGVGNGHNDTLLMLPVLLALWAWERAQADRRPPAADERDKETSGQGDKESGLARSLASSPGLPVSLSKSGRGSSSIVHPPSSIIRGRFVIPLLVVAALIKYVALPLIPLAALTLWQTTGGWRARLRLAAWSALLSLAAAIVALFPFYDLRAVWTSLTQQGEIIYMSPVSAILAALRRSAPGVDARTALLLLGAGGALLVWAYQAGRLSRRPARLPLACFEALFALLMLAIWNLRPWYLIWLAGLAALCFDARGATIDDGYASEQPAIVARRSSIALPWPAWRAIAWTIGGLASYAFMIWIEAWWHPGYDLAQIVGAAVLSGPAALVTLAQLATRGTFPARLQGDFEPPRREGHDGIQKIERIRRET